MPHQITYQFDFDGAKPWTYCLKFDDDYRFIPQPTAQVRPWTELDFHQCPHCPLKKASCKQCPVAQNLDQVVEDSKNTLSITRARVRIETSERTFVKECATQDGLRSLFGLIMASSGCPHLDWFRPLARFHLPFADIDETLFRVLSLQLLSQFLSGTNTDLSKTSTLLEERYRTIEKVNHAFVNRIRSYCKADADKNAIAALDVFVQLFPMQLEANFSTLRPFFQK